MKDSKKLYYNIYNEFYSVNKFRELKNIAHHGTTRLSHINRVSKLSFYISKALGWDYISCTRGAIMHDFLTTDDLSRSNIKWKSYLKKHPVEALNNSISYFEVNNIEEDIILSHMYPITKKMPAYKEAKVVCLCDKLVGIYEFFRFEVKSNAMIALFFCLKFIR